jgi:hypothetical protein
LSVVLTVMTASQTNKQKILTGSLINNFYYVLACTNHSVNLILPLCHSLTPPTPTGHGRDLITFTQPPTSPQPPDFNTAPGDGPLTIHTKHWKLSCPQQSVIRVSTASCAVRQPVRAGKVLSAYPFNRRPCHECRLWWCELDCGASDGGGRSSWILTVERLHFYYLSAVLLHVVQTGSGVHPTSYTMGTGSSFPGVKRPGREVEHSPPTMPRSRKCGSIHPLPHTPSWRSA